MFSITKKKMQKQKYKLTQIDEELKTEIFLEYLLPTNIQCDQFVYKNNTYIFVKSKFILCQARLF